MAALLRVALDTNLFIYVLEEHPNLCRHALRIFAAIEAGSLYGQASELVYPEALSKPTMTVQQIATATSFMSDININFMAVSQQVLVEAAVLRRSIGLKTPDAIHVSSASVNGCDYFITNDVDLIKKGEIDGVKMVALKDFRL